MMIKLPENVNIRIILIDKKMEAILWDEG